MVSINARFKMAPDDNSYQSNVNGLGNVTKVSNLNKRFESFMVDSSVKISGNRTQTPKKIVVMRHESMRDFRTLEYRKGLKIDNFEPISIQKEKKYSEILM